jgi:hypothetical protein
MSCRRYFLLPAFWCVPPPDFFSLAALRSRAALVHRLVPAPAFFRRRVDRAVLAFDVGLPPVVARGAASRVGGCQPVVRIVLCLQPQRTTVPLQAAAGDGKVGVRHPELARHQLEVDSVAGLLHVRRRPVVPVPSPELGSLAALGHSTCAAVQVAQRKCRLTFGRHQLFVDQRIERFGNVRVVLGK